MWEPDRSRSFVKKPQHCKEDAAVTTCHSLGMPTEDEVDAATMALRVWTFRQGLMVSVMLHLGHRLGLFESMAGRGPLSAADVASIAGLDERWCLEWLRSMAAADIIDSETGDRFTLSGAAADVLVDRSGSLLNVGGALGPPPDRELIDAIATSFVTGVGVPYDAHGPAGAHQVDAVLAPWSRHGIVTLLLPRIDGLVDALHGGCRVADVGCGAATLLSVLATEFPRSSFVGLDPSAHALELGRDRLRTGGVDNVELSDHGAERLAEHGTFDVVLTFDCLHDMPFPDAAAANVAESLAPDGVWLIKEIRTSGDFAIDRKNPLLAMMYATSVMTCMSSALSEPGGAGLGTLGLPMTAVEDLVGSVGFAEVTAHDIGDPANIYYEVRR